MIKNHINLNNKKKRLVATTAAAAITVMLVVSIATIGAAPFSVQQQDPERAPPGLRITSDNIVDGEVTARDLADDVVRVERIGSFNHFTVAAGQQEREILECPLSSTWFPIGGGYQIKDSRLIVTESFTSSSSYTFSVYNPTASELGYAISIDCARLVT